MIEFIIKLHIYGGFVLALVFALLLRTKSYRHIHIKEVKGDGIPAEG